MADIKDLFFFFVHAYLIKTGDKAVLFDTGAVVEPDQLPGWCEENGVDPAEIDYIVISHAHWDHIQLAAAWKKLSGAKIICHENAVDYLRNGRKEGAMFEYGSDAKAFPPFIDFMDNGYPESIQPVEPDIIVGDEGYDLHELGISGKIVYVPGHADSAISLVLDDRTAFTGDTVIDLHTVQILEDKFPPDTISMNWIRSSDEEISASVRKLIEEADTFYPGHGRILSRADLQALV